MTTSTCRSPGTVPPPDRAGRDRSRRHLDDIRRHDERDARTGSGSSRATAPSIGSAAVEVADPRAIFSSFKYVLLCQRTTCSTGPNTSCLELARAVEFDDRGRDISARRGRRPILVPAKTHARRACRRSSGRACPWPRRRSPGRHGWRGRADRRAPIRARRPAIMSSTRVGDVLLHAEQPQRRAALAGGAESRGDDVVGHLLGQRGGIDDHGVDAAGLGDQRRDRAVLGGERAVDDARDFGRAGEGDAGDARGRR